MSLRIIATGGTFDKHYDPITGQLVFVDSVLPEALARARITDPTSVEPLMAIDSLDMNDTHRAQILSACERSAEHKIVIIHGTDTLRETAQVLGHLLTQHEAQLLFGNRLIGARKVLLQCIIHQRLIPGPGFFRTRPELVKDSVIDENRDTRLALLRDDRTAPAI